MNQPNPYQAPESSVDDAYSADLHHLHGHKPLASRLSRLGAAIIDYMSVAVPGMMAAIIIPAMTDSEAAMGMMVAVFGFAVLGVVAYNLYRLHTHGQTIGKQLLNIQIVRSDQQTPASVWRIVGFRILPMSLIGIIPLVGGLIQLADPLLIFADDRRCIHDHIADTTVVEFHPGAETTPDPSGRSPYDNRGRVDFRTGAQDELESPVQW